jgi:hypothetical protein
LFYFESPKIRNLFAKYQKIIGETFFRLAKPWRALGWCVFKFLRKNDNKGSVLVKRDHTWDTFVFHFYLKYVLPGKRGLDQAGLVNCA